MQKRIGKCKSFVSVVVAMVFVFLSVICSASARAADFEVILGTSSGFNVVRGSSVASGTSTFYIGSSTVSVGTTTQNTAMFHVVGSSTSSTDAAFMIGTNTLWVGNDGKISIGTTTPSGYDLLVYGNFANPDAVIGTITSYVTGNSSGTVTVNSHLEVTGTLTAGLFIGNGSGLTNIETTINNTSITPSEISTGSTTVSTLTATGSATVTGTLTAGGGGFTVDASGSTTVSTFRSTGSATVTGTLNAGATTLSTLTSGSSTVSDLQVNGSLTVTGSITAGGGAFVVDDAGSVTATYLALGSTGTLSAGYITLTDGTITVGTNKFVVWNTGSVTAAGTITAVGGLSVGTITADANTHGTTSVNFPNWLLVGTITALEATHGTTTVHFPGGINVTGPKNFLIPHPDPAKDGWMLKHSCVEGPTRGDTLYRYTVEVKTNSGESLITLPQYWKHLNENPQVWVTAVGQFSNGYGYVDGISGKLIIKGEKKGVYNVLLMGTRKDRYAKKFDETGVEYVDEERYRMLTGGVKPDAQNVQFINARSAMGERKDGLGELQLIELSHSGGTTKQYMDPLWAEWDIEGVK